MHFILENENLYHVIFEAINDTETAQYITVTLDRISNCIKKERKKKKEKKRKRKRKKRNKRGNINIDIAKEHVDKWSKKNYLT